MSRAVVLVAVLGLGGCKSSHAPERAPTADLPIASEGAPLATAKPSALVFVSEAGRYEIAAVPAAWDGSLGLPRRPAADLKAVMGVVAPPPPEPDPPAEHPAATAAALEGIHEFHPTHEEPELARQHAIDDARRAGLFDNYDRQYGELAGALAVPIASLHDWPLVLASPRAPALAVVRLAAETNMMLGVSLGDRTAVLDLGLHAPLHPNDKEGPGWLELSYDAETVTVLDAATGTPHVVAMSAGVVDSAALGKVLAELKSATAVDLLVGPGLTVQELVDWIAAVRAAGWTAISVVESKDGVDARSAAMKVARGPHVSIGQPNANGDLEKAEIRKVVKTGIDAFLKCYETGLATDPKLRGTVSVQFVIANDGTVKNATASGLAPPVATCVAAVIQRLTFPKPKGGGIVMVNYPFTFHMGG